jgi:hypothetical protein
MAKDSRGALIPPAPAGSPARTGGVATAPAPTVTTARAGDATATTALAAGPTETGSLTYDPAPGDPDVTVAFGKTFFAGKAVEIDDPRQFAKLSGNPNFRKGGARSAGEARDPDREALDKARQKATEEAQEKRSEANVAVADAAAAERAQRALTDLSSAMGDPDRDPPLTNHPQIRA